MESGFQMKASLVVAVIDDYTNRVLTDGSVKVSIAGEKPAIRKRDGYFVFINLRAREGEVVVEGDSYQTRRTSFGTKNVQTLEAKWIRVHPNPSYEYQVGVRWVNGKAQAGELVMFRLQGREGGYRLRSDYEPEEGVASLCVRHDYGIRLDEKLLWMQGAEGEGELVRFGKCLDYQEGRYQLKGKLSHRYKKTDAVLQVTYAGMADGEGRFEIALPKKGKEERVWENAYV